MACEQITRLPLDQRQSNHRGVYTGHLSDGFLQQHVLLRDFEVTLLELVRDVFRRHRAEHLVLLVAVAADGEVQLRQAPLQSLYACDLGHARPLRRILFLQKLRPVAVRGVHDHLGTSRQSGALPNARQSGALQNAKSSGAFARVIPAAG